MKNSILFILILLIFISCNPQSSETEYFSASSNQLNMNLTEAEQIFQEDIVTQSTIETNINRKSYYVSPEGSDNNTGTMDSPWASPGYATRMMEPGSILYFLPGTYYLSTYDEDILIPPSGNHSAWTQLIGLGEQKPVLAGKDNLISAIDLAGKSYVFISNLEITHDTSSRGEAQYFRDAISILGAPASNIVLEDLYIHHIDEFGINLQDVQDIKIINCVIEYAGFGSIGGPEAENGGIQNMIIQESRLSYSGHYYQGGDGTNRPYDRPDGFGIEESSGPIIIMDTVAEHNYGDGLDSKADNTAIRNCIVANNSCDGIKLWGTNSVVENTLIYGRGDGEPEETPWAAVVIDSDQNGAVFELNHVTIDEYLGQNYLIYVNYDHPEVEIKLNIFNSIFSSMGESSTLFFAHAVDLHMINNLFYMPNNEPLIEIGNINVNRSEIQTYGIGNIYGDPLFIEPAWGWVGNYQLMQNSPAIDRADFDTSISIDLLHNERDQLPDIGAYEYMKE